MTESTIETPVVEQVIPETVETTETTETTAEATVDSQNEFTVDDLQTETPVETFDLDKVLSKHRDDIIKKLGFDDFDLEFSKFRKEGNDPYKYLEAKTFDWNKVSDVDVFKHGLTKKYQGLTQDEVNILYNAELKRFGLHEDATDEEKQIGQIHLKAAAKEIRDAEIAAQQSFKIPEVQKQEQVDQVALVKAQIESNPVTKELFESKKVVFGTNDKFTFKVNPDELVRLQYDPEVQKKYLFNEQGEPDLRKSYAMALMAKLGPDAFVDHFINYGKRLGKSELLDEGQNITRQIVQTPGSPATEAEAMRNARTGRIGS